MRNHFLATFKLKVLALTYSHIRKTNTTIGAEGLNYCVRNENRCTPFAGSTRTSSSKKLR